MLEVKGDLWQYTADVRCITTNGHVKHNGELVMGRGCAKEATRTYPQIAYYLGGVVKRKGNIVNVIAPSMLDRLAEVPEGTHEWWLYTFPVKHFWRDQADINLIRLSARQLIDKLDNYSEGMDDPDELVCVLPRPGCGNGRLSWDYVKGNIVDILDDRVHVISHE